MTSPCIHVTSDATCRCDHATGYVTIHTGSQNRATGRVASDSNRPDDVQGPPQSRALQE